MIGSNISKQSHTAVIEHSGEVTSRSRAIDCTDGAGAADAAIRGDATGWAATPIAENREIDCTARIGSACSKL